MIKPMVAQKAMKAKPSARPQMFNVLAIGNLSTPPTMVPSIVAVLIWGAAAKLEKAPLITVLLMDEWKASIKKQTQILHLGDLLEEKTEPTYRVTHQA